MLTTAFLPVMPASADSTGTVLDIGITEIATHTDTYDPLASPAQAVTDNTATGTVKISNTLAGKDLSDVTVVLDKGGNTITWAQTFDGSSIATSDFHMTDSAPGTSSGTITVHIPVLPNGKYALLTYTVATPVLPVSLTASYSTDKVPDTQGSGTSVTLNLVKNGLRTDILDSNINNIQVTIAPGTGWALGSGATSDGTISTSSPDLVWAATSPTGSATFSETVSDPTQFINAGSASGLNQYPLATSTLVYTITSTGISALGHVTVSTTPTATTTDAKVDVTKHLLGSGNDMYWQFTPEVDNSVGSGVSYTLSAVSLVITDSNVGTTFATQPISSGTIGGIAANLQTTLAAGQSWIGSYVNVHSISGTNTAQNLYGFTTGVPVGFVKPTMSIANDGTQIGSHYTNDQNTVTFQKFIWVIDDYYIEATKTITYNGGGDYTITLKVQNIGSKTSPDVIVYDVIPSSFDGPTNINLLDKTPTTIAMPSARFPAITSHSGLYYTGQQAAVTIAGTTGSAYWWNVAQLSASGQSTDTVYVTYHVSGSGDYPVSQLYIVGLDPSLTSGLQSTPFLQNNVTITNANFESLAALCALGLILVGLVGTVRRKF